MACLDNIKIIKEKRKSLAVEVYPNFSVVIKSPEQAKDFEIKDLENNSNIIWKTTDTSSGNKGIPVINNNKLKPEVVKDNGNMAFPDLKKKEGEVLWKETL